MNTNNDDWLYTISSKNKPIDLNFKEIWRYHHLLLLFPSYILMMAMLGLRPWMILSSMTTKYRDMNVVVGFGVSLLIYRSAVPYPLSKVHEKVSSLGCHLCRV